MNNALKFLVSLMASLAALECFALELMPLNQVQITSGPFLAAEQTNKAYLLALDEQKLLAPFLREAGLAHGDTYGNWESSGLDGHIGGHYLSALALMYASTGDKEVLRRLNYFVAQLKKCQNKNGNGYIGGIPNGKKAWDEIAQGDLRADNFSTNNLWVPWYNLHKTFAGLRDAYKYAGNKDARNMLIKLSDWALALTNHLTEQQMQDMLRTEQGGMNEVLADVADITGDKKYLQLAKRFSQQTLLQPLEKDQDQLTGLHANTQIPKVIGFKRIGDDTHNADWKEAAEFFWETVVNQRSVAIGGNSVKEHFHDKKDFTPMIEEVEGPETCNTYNMLKLTELLFKSNPQGKYADYYERALYNHILSSQNPDTGGFVYFTPMRPNHYRVYSQVQKGMWCCVGSGLESQSKYGEFIYARDLPKHGFPLVRSVPQVYVNLFIASRMNWKEQGIRLQQSTLFPDEERTQIRIDSNKKFALHIRYPAWVKTGQLQLRLNGKVQKLEAKPGSYFTLERRWKKGDSIELQLPMHKALEQLPDGSNYYAVLYGPIVLAAKTHPFTNEQLNYFADDSRMGHVAWGKQCPLEAAPFLLGNSQQFIDQLKPVPGQPLTFSASGLINGQNAKDLQLIPFFRLHDSRYMIYWPYTAPADIEQARAKAAAEEKARLDLIAHTIDQVSPGEQQPESDHFYKGEQSEAGVYSGHHWRHTRAWFSYELNDKGSEAKTLQITYAGVDKGRRFSIVLNDQVIATVESTGSAEAFFTVDYAIPAGLVKAAKGKLVVKFVAAPGSVAGGIYGVRLLRQ